MASRRPLVNVSGTISELPSGDTVIGVGAASVSFGTVDIDFGSTPVAEKLFTVTDANISAGMIIEAFVMAVDATGDNNTEAHQHAAASWQMTCNPTNGSFDLNITCLMDLCWDVFRIHYLYST
jgi:hypothetical protein